MIATSSRKAVAGVAALAALALAGCTPPHQNPSSEKVDTATTQDPNSLKLSLIHISEPTRRS